MSAKSKGKPSSSCPAEGPPAASKTKVKEQIKIIVEDLELVLGDLKDVAKELKEVRGAGVGTELGALRPLRGPLPIFGRDRQIAKLLGNYRKGACRRTFFAPGTPERSCCCTF